MAEAALYNFLNIFLVRRPETKTNQKRLGFFSDTTLGCYLNRILSKMYVVHELRNVYNEKRCMKDIYDVGEIL